MIAVLGIHLLSAFCTAVRKLLNWSAGNAKWTVCDFINMRVKDYVVIQSSIRYSVN